MQLEPKEEEEVDELQGDGHATIEAAGSSMMDEDTEGNAAAATLMQASTSILNAASSS